MKVGRVYAFRTPEYVKVGWTNFGVASRKAQLESGHPYDLVTVMDVPGTRTEERFVHGILAPFHHKGEWFKWNAGSESVLKEFELGKYARIHSNDVHSLALLKEADEMAWLFASFLSRGPGEGHCYSTYVERLNHYQQLRRETGANIHFPSIDISVWEKG